MEEANPGHRDLKSYLSARKVVNVGSQGFDLLMCLTGDWQMSRMTMVKSGIRSGKPLVEVRVPFELELCELDSVDREPRM